MSRHASTQQKILLTDLNELHKLRVLRPVEQFAVEIRSLTSSLLRATHKHPYLHHHYIIRNVSQGSVATYVRCGGMPIQDCIANFLLSMSVKEFLKSVKI